MAEAARKLQVFPHAGLVMYDDLPLPVCAVSPAGDLVYANAAFCSFVQRDLEEFRGSPVKDVINSSVIRESDLIERCQQQLAPVMPEASTVYLGEGQVRDIRIKAIPYLDADGTLLSVLTIQDFSAEEILQTRHKMQLDELTRKAEEIRKYSEGLELLVEERTKELRSAMVQSERLLLNILPKPVADMLKVSESTIAQRHENVTVLFCDIVNFTAISAVLDPAQVVEFLGRVYDIFDRALDRYKVEKIKTIGDCYLAVTGAPVYDEEHAVSMCNFALDMRAEILRLNAALDFDLHARFGINSGPIIAGVIGQRRFAYDIWGDAVNVASRLEAHSEPDRIQISASTYELVKHDFVCRKRGVIQVKGKGDFMAYWLIDRR
jgi:class 3 adenylate cyclase